MNQLISHTTSPPSREIIVLILKMKKLGHRAVKWFTQSHAASKQQSQDLNPGRLAPESSTAPYFQTTSKTRSLNLNILLYSHLQTTAESTRRNCLKTGESLQPRKQGKYSHKRHNKSPWNVSHIWGVETSVGGKVILAQVFLFKKRIKKGKVWCRMGVTEQIQKVELDRLSSPGSSRPFNKYTDDEWFPPWRL